MLEKLEKGDFVSWVFDASFSSNFAPLTSNLLYNDHSTSSALTTRRAKTWTSSEWPGERLTCC